MNKSLKVFSLERSFSNFLIKTLLDNFQEYKEESIIQQPWKHMVPPHDLSEYAESHKDRLSEELLNEGVDIYLCLKDPYKWIVSYFRGFAKGHLRKDHYKSNPDDIVSQYVDHLPPKASDSVLFDVLLNKYNQWLRSALALEQGYENSMLITYDGMLHTPTEVLDNIQEKFNLLPSQAMWQIEGKEVGTGHRLKQNSYDDSFWTEGKYWNLLEDWQIERINEKMDWELFEMIGVEKIES